MITCTEINRAIKEGKTVTAHVPGFIGEQRVFRARVGLCDRLEVQFLVDGEKRWRSTFYSSVSVEGSEVKA